MHTKTCTDCGIEKAITNFNKNNTKDGFFRRCKVCTYARQKERINNNRDAHNKKQREYKRKWAKENPKAYRRQRAIQSLRIIYGITIEQYDEMFAAQDGVCAICGRKETQKNRHGTRRLSVDHDHLTKQVRGLLCAKCNSIIGFADDDTDILESAINYLEKP